MSLTFAPGAWIYLLIFGGSFIVIVTSCALMVLRAKNKWIRLATIFAIMGIPLLLLYLDGFIGSSVKRLARDHSFDAPVSVTDISCDGFVTLTTFIDDGASAHFKMARSDISRLLSQFKNHSGSHGSDWTPSTSPTGFGKLIETYDGVSQRGNVMHIDIYDINSTQVGVIIATQWN